MKGIFYKDICTLINNKKQFALILAIGIVFTFVFQDGGQYITMMFSLLLLMFVYSSFSYDESAKWDRYAVSMPVKRSAVVGSKYLLTLLCAAASLVFSFAIILVSWRLGFIPGILAGMASTFAVVGVMLFALAIVLPIIFQFGVEKARILTLLIMLLPYGALILGMTYLPQIKDHIPTLLLRLLPWLIPLLLLVMMLISYMVSVRTYTKKEF